MDPTGARPSPDWWRRARDGDKRRWDAIVVPLCAADLGRSAAATGWTGPTPTTSAQSVWLRLVDQLDVIREPAALPGWIATTTRRECGRVVSVARKREVLGYTQDVRREHPG